MEDWGFSVSISSLICQENHSLLNDDDDEDYDDVTNTDSNLWDSEDDYIDILVSKESSAFSSTQASPYVTDIFLKWARSDAIQWILKTRAYFNFSYQTAYLAVSYYDRFVMRRNIDKGDSWVVRLLSVACLSLAAKMEECTIPSLSEYQSEEECKFASSAIQRMELLIMSTLEWRMSSSVTPFAYLSYFISKLHQRGNSKSRQSVSESTGFIFAIIDGINLVDHRPSTIAAAAVLAAFNQRLNKEILESKLSIFSSSGTFELDQVYSCYAMMVEESLKSGSSVGDNNTVSSTASNKRRRVD